MFTGTLDPASTRADWNLVVSFVDDETQEPLDLAGASILVEVRDRLSGASVLSASTVNGKVSIVDTGTFHLSIDAHDMRALRADMYEVGGIYSLNGATRQFVIGLLPVIDGIVS